ncbi:hypothetical protein V6N12_071665 [Hibiscus sabdariffa]|uniref:Uncharacterized protein n=1 Tax=Hibiscus sabdariffa TaxID=183260 RepID=A0ABR2FKH5_9ROSI
MELSLHSLTFASYCKTFGDSGPKVQSALDYRACSMIIVKSKEHRRKLSTRSPSPALAETAASVAIAAAVVGGAATFLVRRTKASDPTEPSPLFALKLKRSYKYLACFIQASLGNLTKSSGGVGASGKWASAPIHGPGNVDAQSMSF